MQMFDSSEELYFSWYLNDLKNKGYIKYYSRSGAYVLSDPCTATNIKIMKRVPNKVLEYSYVRGHKYTPDFYIEWTDKAKGIFFNDSFDTSARMIDYPFLVYRIKENNEYKICSEIEVKPKFDQNNMTRLAMINIKWLYSKYGILTTVIIPQKLFKETFTPDRYLTTDKSKKGRKIKWAVKSMNDFINK